LVDGWEFESCLRDFFQVFDIAEDFSLRISDSRIIFRSDVHSLVGYPHRSELSRFLGSQKCFPSLKANNLSPVGTVYEIEIERIYWPGLVPE
jgi:hypothetical protein